MAAVKWIKIVTDIFDDEKMCEYTQISCEKCDDVCEYSYETM